MCRRRGGDGAHPLGPPGPDGIATCPCGMVTRHPARPARPHGVDTGVQNNTTPPTSPAPYPQ